MSYCSHFLFQSFIKKADDVATVRFEEEKSSTATVRLKVG